jgi:hypothetical protein
MTIGVGHPLLIIERILRDRDSVWRQVVEERNLKPLVTQMLVSSALSLFVYGAVLGASHSFPQAVSSATKLPLLFLATLAICLPTLYLFNLVFGARLSVTQAVALIMVSITVTSVLTLAFAPISLFFLISAHNYAFVKVLNVGILVLTAFIGLRFLTQGMAHLNAHREADRPPVEVLVTESKAEEPALALVAAAANGSSVDPEVALPPASPGALPHQRPATPAGNAAVPTRRPASMTLLYIWIALFGFVGTQLAWALRPFFGSPDEPFALFRDIDGTFYGDIFATIGALLS